jgi:DNA-binding MarR family transcriptional regulator
MPISIKPFLEYALAKKIDHLTVRQLFVLTECADGPKTIKYLAAKGSVNKPAMSRAADKLEKARLIVRRPDPKDGRSVDLVMAKAGAKFMAAFE